MIAVAALDGVPSHDVSIVQQVLAVPGRVIHHGPVGGDGIVHGLLEMPLLRLDGEGLIAVRQLAVRQERNANGCRMANRFRQHTELVVEVPRRPHVAVEPRRVAGSRSHGGAGFALGRHAGVDGGSERLDPQWHQRIVDVVERVAERRREHDGARGPGLVVVVHDLRIPVPVHDP